MVSPLVSACLLALGIDSCSNIIAQHLRAWKNDVPYEFDWALFIQFAVLVIVGAPINFHWQAWLEKTFPGWKMVPKKDVEKVDIEQGSIPLSSIDAGKENQEEERHRSDEEYVRVRNWWNIFRKWFTDCITMGALLNTTLFLVVMGVLKGKGIGQIGSDLRTEMFPIIFDSYKIWPIANFFSTTFCPVERRIVFLSCCGLLWNIYLSLVAARL